MRIRYLIINERQEALGSLCYLKELLDKLDLKVYRWKWIVIALHNCLQNFMVSCLSGSNYLDVLTEDSSKKWYDFLLKLGSSQIKDKEPKRRMEEFLKLYGKIQSSQMLRLTISKKFVADEEHTHFVKELNRWRNNFIHFIPQEKMLGITNLPLMTLKILSIIEFLAYESGNFRWRDNKEKEQYRLVIVHLKKKLELLEENYK